MENSLVTDNLEEKINPYERIYKDEDPNKIEGVDGEIICVEKLREELGLQLDEEKINQAKKCIEAFNVLRGGNRKAEVDLNNGAYRLFENFPFLDQALLFLTRSDFYELGITNSEDIEDMVKYIKAFLVHSGLKAYKSFLEEKGDLSLKRLMSIIAAHDYGMLIAESIAPSEHALLKEDIGNVLQKCFEKETKIKTTDAFAFRLLSICKSTNPHPLTMAMTFGDVNKLRNPKEKEYECDLISHVVFASIAGADPKIPAKEFFEPRPRRSGEDSHRNIASLRRWSYDKKDLLSDPHSELAKSFRLLSHGNDEMPSLFSRYENQPEKQEVFRKPEKTKNKGKKSTRKFTNKIATRVNAALVAPAKKSEQGSKESLVIPPHAEWTKEALLKGDSFVINNVPEDTVVLVRMKTRKKKNKIHKVPDGGGWESLEKDEQGLYKIPDSVNWNTPGGDIRFELLVGGAKDPFTNLTLDVPRLPKDNPDASADASRSVTTKRNSKKSFGIGKKLGAQMNDNSGEKATPEIPFELEIIAVDLAFEEPNRILSLEIDEEAQKVSFILDLSDLLEGEMISLNLSIFKDGNSFRYEVPEWFTKSHKATMINTANSAWEALVIQKKKECEAADLQKKQEEEARLEKEEIRLKEEEERRLDEWIEGFGIESNGLEESNICFNGSGKAAWHKDNLKSKKLPYKRTTQREFFFKKLYSLQKSLKKKNITFKFKETPDGKSFSDFYFAHVVDRKSFFNAQVKFSENGIDELDLNCPEDRLAEEDAKALIYSLINKVVEDASEFIREWEVVHPEDIKRRSSVRRSDVSKEDVEFKKPTDKLRIIIGNFSDPNCRKFEILTRTHKHLADNCDSRIEEHGKGNVGVVKHRPKYSFLPVVRTDEGKDHALACYTELEKYEGRRRIIEERIVSTLGVSMNEENERTDMRTDSVARERLIALLKETKGMEVFFDGEDLRDTDKKPFSKHRKKELRLLIDDAFTKSFIARIKSKESDLENPMMGISFADYDIWDAEAYVKQYEMKLGLAESKDASDEEKKEEEK